MPTTEQKLDGHLIDPPVSEPRDNGICNEATAAALPPEEPPATYSRFQGFRTGPKAECSDVVPMPNSSIFNLPITIPSCFSILLTTVALYGEA